MSPSLTTGFVLPSGAASSAAAAAALLRLPWRRNAWRGPSGEWSGVGLGNSVDFQDHRPYSPGDDLRYVNWAAYARTDSLLLKVHRHEALPAVDLVCDISASMWLGEAKARRSAELMLFALESAERHAGAVRCYAVSGKTATLLAAAALRRGEWPAAGVSGEPPALDLVPWRAEALRVLVSDLLFPPAAGAAWTRRLGGARGVGLVLVPWSAEEAAPAWDGRVDFEDCETAGRREQRVDADLLARYRSAYARHVAGWREACRRAGVLMARVPAEPELIDALNAEALPAGVIEPQR